MTNQEKLGLLVGLEEVDISEIERQEQERKEQEDAVHRAKQKTLDEKVAAAKSNSNSVNDTYQDEQTNSNNQHVQLQAEPDVVVSERAARQLNQMKQQQQKASVAQEQQPKKTKKQRKEALKEYQKRFNDRRKEKEKNGNNKTQFKYDSFPVSNDLQPPYSQPTSEAISDNNNNNALEENEADRVTARTNWKSWGNGPQYQIVSIKTTAPENSGKRKSQEEIQLSEKEHLVTLDVTDENDNESLNSNSVKIKRSWIPNFHSNIFGTYKPLEQDTAISSEDNKKEQPSTSIAEDQFSEADILNQQEEELFKIFQEEIELESFLKKEQERILAQNNSQSGESQLFSISREEIDNIIKKREELEQKKQFLKLQKREAFDNEDINDFENLVERESSDDQKEKIHSKKSKKPQSTFDTTEIIPFLQETETEVEEDIDNNNVEEAEFLLKDVLLVRQIIQLEEENQQLKLDISGHQGRKTDSILQKLEAYAKCQEKIEKLKLELQTFRHQIEIDGVKENIANTQSQIKSVHRKLLSHRYDRLQFQSTVSNTILTLNDKLIAELNSSMEILQLRQNLASAQEKQNLFQIELESLLPKKQQVDEENAALNEQLEIMKSELATKTTGISQLAKKLAHAMEVIEVEKIKETEAEFTQQLFELKKETKDLQRQITKVEESIEKNNPLYLYFKNVEQGCYQNKMIIEELKLKLLVKLSEEFKSIHEQIEALNKKRKMGSEYVEFELRSLEEKLNSNRKESEALQSGKFDYDSSVLQWQLTMLQQQSLKLNEENQKLKEQISVLQEKSQQLYSGNYGKELTLRETIAKIDERIKKQEIEIVDDARRIEVEEKQLEGLKKNLDRTDVFQQIDKLNKEIQKLKYIKYLKENLVFKLKTEKNLCSNLKELKYLNKQMIAELHKKEQELKTFKDQQVLIPNLESNPVPVQQVETTYDNNNNNVEEDNEEIAFSVIIQSQQQSRKEDTNNNYNAELKAVAESNQQKEDVQQEENTNNNNHAELNAVAEPNKKEKDVKEKSNALPPSLSLSILEAKLRTSPSQRKEPVKFSSKKEKKDDTYWSNFLTRVFCSFERVMGLAEKTIIDGSEPVEVESEVKPVVSKATPTIAADTNSKVFHMLDSFDNKKEQTLLIPQKSSSSLDDKLLRNKEENFKEYHIKESMIEIRRFTTTLLAPYKTITADHEIQYTAIPSNKATLRLLSTNIADLNTEFSVVQYLHSLCLCIKSDKEGESLKLKIVRTFMPQKFAEVIQDERLDKESIEITPKELKQLEAFSVQLSKEVAAFAAARATDNVFAEHLGELKYVVRPIKVLELKREKKQQEFELEEAIAEIKQYVLTLVASCNSDTNNNNNVVQNISVEDQTLRALSSKMPSLNAGVSVAYYLNILCSCIRPDQTGAELKVKIVETLMPEKFSREYENQVLIAEWQNVKTLYTQLRAEISQSASKKESNEFFTTRLRALKCIPPKAFHLDESIAEIKQDVFTLLAPYKIDANNNDDTRKAISDEKKTLKALSSTMSVLNTETSVLQYLYKLCSCIKADQEGKYLKLLMVETFMPEKFSRQDEHQISEKEWQNIDYLYMELNRGITRLVQEKKTDQSFIEYLVSSKYIFQSKKSLEPANDNASSTSFSWDFLKTIGSKLKPKEPEVKVLKSESDANALMEEFEEGMRNGKKN